jgi:hypothetical protein
MKRSWLKGLAHLASLLLLKFFRLKTGKLKILLYASSLKPNKTAATPLDYP